MSIATRAAGGTTAAAVGHLPAAQVYKTLEPLPPQLPDVLLPGQ